MSTNIKIIKTTAVLSIVALLAAGLFAFYMNQTKVNWPFWSNLFLGIFSSSSLAFLIALTQYFREKRKCLFEMSIATLDLYNEISLFYKKLEYYKAGGYPYEKLEQDISDFSERANKCLVLIRSIKLFIGKCTINNFNFIFVMLSEYCRLVKLSLALDGYSKNEDSKTDADLKKLIKFINDYKIQKKLDNFQKELSNMLKHSETNQQEFEEKIIKKCLDDLKRWNYENYTVNQQRPIKEKRYRRIRFDKNKNI